MYSQKNSNVPPKYILLATLLQKYLQIDPIDPKKKGYLLVHPFANCPMNKYIYIYISSNKNKPNYPKNNKNNL